MTGKHESRAPRRWLLLMHQLPSTPSNLRVRTWRRLRQLGAVAVKQAAYVLPDSPPAREDFEWLKGEIEAAGRITVARARDVTGSSRKHVLPLLQFLDDHGITRRLGDDRVLMLDPAEARKRAAQLSEGRGAQS